jgi:hypothetical protein
MSGGDGCISSRIDQDCLWFLVGLGQLERGWAKNDIGWMSHK